MRQRSTCMLLFYRSWSPIYFISKLCRKCDSGLHVCCCFIVRDRQYISFQNFVVNATAVYMYVCCCFIVRCALLPVQCIRWQTCFAIIYIIAVISLTLTDNRYKRSCPLAIYSFLIDLSTACLKWPLDGPALCLCKSLLPSPNPIIGQ